MSDKIKDIESRLLTVSDPRERADILINLSWELRLSDPQRGLQLADQANQLSRELSYSKGLADSKRCAGTNYFFLSEFIQAITASEKAVTDYKYINNTDGQATALNWMGNSYFRLGDYSKALQCHIESMRLRKDSNDLKGEADSLNNIGTVYWALGDYDSCLEYHFKSLNICEKLEDKYGVANSMNNIGAVYGDLKDYKNALVFLIKSYEINKGIGNRQEEMVSFQNIGENYFNLTEYDIALDYYTKGLNISEELGEYVFRVVLLRGIGSVYQKTGNIEKAFEYYLHGLKISSDVGCKDVEHSVLISLGTLYVQTAEMSQGLQNLQRSLLIAEELKSKSMMSESHYALSQAYQHQGDYSKALMHCQKYHDVDKEIFNESSDKKRQASMIKFQVEQKEKEAEIYRLRNVELAEANQAITQAKEIIEEKNRHITSSIEYARRIQQAVLPPAGKMQAALPEHFVLFKPRDIVSGDFYWFSQTGGKILIAVVDCTGHGVPGAFMSMIGSMLLNTIVNENGETGPAKVLEQLHLAVRTALKQHDAEADTTDGMDVCLCAIEQGSKRLVYAGAKRPLYLVRNNELTEIAGDGKSIGGRQKEEKRAFSDKRIELQDGDMLCLTSDGYADQCDSEGRKIGSRRMKELLVMISGQDSSAQREALLAELARHQGNEEQRDDIAIVGIRIIHNKRSRNE